MNILDRFEETMEQLIEGSIGRIMRSPVQPAEIGRKLERAMLAHQVISVGGIMVPNEYRVAMHPADIARFSDYLDSVCTDMERWLSDLATERGLVMVGRPAVQIVPDTTIRRRTIQVSASVHTHQPRRPAPKANRTEVFQPLQQAESALRLRIVAGPGKGQEVSLDKDSLSVGRATDNDLVIGAADVSRHHARLERHRDHWQVIDLNSTNGTKVNGNRVHQQSIDVGDRIEFGSAAAELIADRR